MRLELFGESILEIIWSSLLYMAKSIVVGSVVVFALPWFIPWILRAKHSIKPKNYSVLVYDVNGNQITVDGIRTKFSFHDVAWSYMKQYKKSYPLYNFALVSDVIRNGKKTIFKYI